MNALKKTNTQPFNFTVATFNMFNYIAPPNAFYEFNQIYTSEQWNKKNEWISTYLDKNSPDIIGLQEVFSPEPLKTLLLENGYSYFKVVDEPEVIDEFIYKSPVVAIASKYPIVECTSIDVEPENRAKLGVEKNFSFSRKVIRATIELPIVGFIDVYVVHLKSKRPTIEHEHTSDFSVENNTHEQFKSQLLGQWASSIQRGSEAVLLHCEILQRKKDKQHPVILLGDFNDILNSSELNTFNTSALRFGLQNTPYITSYLLYDSWNVYLENRLPETESYEPLTRKHTHYYGNKGSVLDFILLSDEFNSKSDQNIFEVIDYITLDKHIVSPSFDIDGYSTDHAIVQISIAISVFS